MSCCGACWGRKRKVEFAAKDLTLRTVTEADLPEVARMWDFAQGGVSPEQAREAIAGMEANHRKNRPGSIYHLCLGIFPKGSSQIIGWCGLDGTTPGKLHIFYMLAPEFRNRGYATQCAKRLLAYAFEEAGVPFVNGGCARENAASFRVMQKAGMEQVAFADNGDPLFYVDAAGWRQHGASDASDFIE